MFYRFLFAVAYLVLTFGFLSLDFPIWERMQRFDYSHSHIIGEYLGMSAVVTVICTLLVPLLSLWTNKTGIRESVLLRICIAFALLTIMAIWIGTMDSRRGFPLRGAFFAEWQFVGFILFDAPILSLLAGVYYWWEAKRGAGA